MLTPGSFSPLKLNCVTALILRRRDNSCLRFRVKENGLLIWLRLLLEILRSSHPAVSVMPTTLLLLLLEVDAFLLTREGRIFRGSLAHSRMLLNCSILGVALIDAVRLVQTATSHILHGQVGGLIRLVGQGLLVALGCRHDHRDVAWKIIVILVTLDLSWLLEVATSYLVISVLLLICAGVDLPVAAGCSPRWMQELWCRLHSGGGWIHNNIANTRLVVLRSQNSLLVVLNIMLGLIKLMQLIRSSQLR
jgi:hypothetical protein